MKRIDTNEMQMDTLVNDNLDFSEEEDEDMSVTIGKALLDLPIYTPE